MTVLFRILIAGSLLATITSTLSVYPHQLAYFNEAAGGPENGWKHLLGSNLDWGQDLLLAREWICTAEVDSSDLGVMSNIQSDQYADALLGLRKKGSECYRLNIISVNRVMRDPRRHALTQLTRIGFSHYVFDRKCHSGVNDL